jgi:hypothetical protein
VPQEGKKTDGHHHDVEDPKSNSVVLGGGYQSDEMLLKNEPKADSGHGANFADIFIH